MISIEGGIGMRRNLCTSLLLGAGLMISAMPAFAIDVSVTAVDRNNDGTMTFHYAIETAKGETLLPGEDFVTVYNFSGLIGGSIKAPADWDASSLEFGKTPMKEGYPLVLPVDIPELSNVTWTPKKRIAGATRIEGFSVTSKASGTTEGEYTAQVTRQESEGQGTPPKSSKQAAIGSIPAPSYVAR
jgi:hypothetical protein